MMLVFAYLLSLFIVPVIFTSAEEKFDFIIIGAGSAGAVIANRLSEISKWNILLLEAGSYPDPISAIPGLAGLLQFTSNNWNYTYEPQDTACLGMIDRRCSCPRGKTLGGSSVINFVVYSRGHPQDFDHWVELGNPGWSYLEVLPYFKKSEHAYAKDVNFKYHGTDGPMGTNISYFDELGETFIQASGQLGYPFNPDYNSAEESGFSKIQCNTKHGRRQSTYVSFLQPIFERKNLQVKINAMASKILIDEQKRAFGVEYIQNGTKHFAYASKEVIVSAGAINSPQLLVLSGIGPKEDLERLNISLVEELPVGKGLKEHLMYCGLIITTNLSIGYDYDSALEEFNEQGTGPLSAPIGVTALAFLNTNNDTDAAPDIELLQLPVTLITSNRSLAHMLLVEETMVTEYTKFVNSPNQFTITPALLHPKSTGFIRIESADPFQPPSIFGNFLTEQEDLDTLVRGIRIIQSLLKTPAFRGINATLYDFPVPGCGDLIYDSDEYWFCALRRYTSTVYHASSTCKMGPRFDEEAVVDNELKVHGIDGLRIADASVIPHLTSGHTNAPCMMIGEKVSDLIKAFWIPVNE